MRYYTHMKFWKQKHWINILQWTSVLDPEIKILSWQSKYYFCFGLSMQYPMLWVCSVCKAVSYAWNVQLSKQYLTSLQIFAKPKFTFFMPVPDKEWSLSLGNILDIPTIMFLYFCFIKWIKHYKRFICN
jgi:hypothetical protein